MLCLSSHEPWLPPIGEDNFLNSHKGTINASSLPIPPPSYINLITYKNILSPIKSLLKELEGTKHSWNNEKNLNIMLT